MDSSVEKRVTVPAYASAGVAGAWWYVAAITSTTTGARLGDGTGRLLAEDAVPER